VSYDGQSAISNATGREGEAQRAEGRVERSTGNGSGGVEDGCALRSGATGQGMDSAGASC